MSNLRSILAFAVGSALLGLLLAFSVWQARTTANAHVRPALMRLDVGSVVRLGMKCGGAADAEVALVRGADGRWLLDGPRQVEAERAVVLETLDAFATADTVDALSAADLARMGRTLADFGLDPAEVTVRVEADGRETTFELGRLTASGEEAYARTVGTRGVFTVPAAARRAAARPAADFRRRALFSFSAADVTALSLRRGEAPPVKLVRDASGWRITAPAAAAADAAAADALVRRLAGARAVEFAGADVARADCGLESETALSATLSSALGEPERITFGDATSSNLVYALASDGRTVVRVEAELVRVCDVGEAALRDTRLFPVKAESVARMSLAWGETRCELVRAGGGWRMDSPVAAPADGRSADALLERILTLRQIDLTPAADRAEISVSLLAEGRDWSAVAVPAAALDRVRLPDLRSRDVLRIPRGKLKGVTVKTAAGASWDATRSRRAVARLTEGVAAERVETLEASADDFAKFGLEKPAFTLLVDVDDAESPRRSMLLGGALSGGGRHALLGGMDAAVFVLSAETVSDLTAPPAE